MVRVIPNLICEAVRAEVDVTAISRALAIHRSTIHRNMPEGETEYRLDISERSMTVEANFALPCGLRRGGRAIRLQRRKCR